jgi:hypothetical protein
MDLYIHYPIRFMAYCLICYVQGQLYLTNKFMLEVYSNQSAMINISHCMQFNMCNGGRLMTADFHL